MVDVYPDSLKIHKKHIACLYLFADSVVELKDISICSEIATILLVLFLFAQRTGSTNFHPSADSHALVTSHFLKASANKTALISASLAALMTLSKYVLIDVRR